VSARRRTFGGGDGPVAAVTDAGMCDHRLALPVSRPGDDARLRSLAVPVLALIAVAAPSTLLARARAVQAEPWSDATRAISAECATAVNARVPRYPACRPG
jgi:hypothetical protein